MGWFLPLLLTILFAVISYVLAPRPKKEKPPEVKDIDDPTADAGRPQPVMFGCKTVTGINVLWFGDKSKQTFEVPA